ncbi:ferritin heavy chain-like [Anopheles ziemanni]|uniref:ferritin heavy chain-like n=1 Tax=Anopheles coustani TaxID=139045 RepID=UPI00265B1568|nr:ferritin heavy chain-like [Anopheles coustani]XP_058174090.1 ferritin heavy chain-like [Anopheles ziemanni]
MMKSIFFGIVTLMFAVIVVHQESVFAERITPTQNEWRFVSSKCFKDLHKQINKEFNAAIFYLQYAAYFAQEKVNLPGFEKFFFNAAAEERQHGMMLLEYALMRGQDEVAEGTFKLDFDNITAPVIPRNNFGAEDALKAALKKEQEVTQSIRELIKTCEQTEGENGNEYHLVDYLTGEFLEEQHKGQRDLAGKIAMLKKMLNTNPHLGEFIFDKQNM